MKDNTIITHSGKLRNMASVYLLHEGRILLLYRQGSSIVSNLWIGSAGGHDAKACMIRELSEELSIDEASLDCLSLRYITIRYTDGELRQNYYFFANLRESISQAPKSTEGITKWFSLDSLDDLPMPFTAHHVIKHYLSVLIYTVVLLIETAFIFTNYNKDGTTKSCAVFL